jgi:hypothetical protein
MGVSEMPSTRQDHFFQYMPNTDKPLGYMADFSQGPADGNPIAPAQPGTRYLANTLALEDLQLGLRNGTRETELIQSKWPTKANHKRDVYDGVIMMSVYLTYTVNI